MANSGVLSGIDNGHARRSDAGKSDAHGMHGRRIENRLAPAVFPNRPARSKALKKPRKSWGARILEQKITKITKNSVWNGPFQWLRPGKALLDHFLRKPEQRGEPPSQDCWLTGCSIISGLALSLSYLRFLLVYQ